MNFQIWKFSAMITLSKLGPLHPCLSFWDFSTLDNFSWWYSPAVHTGFLHSLFSFFVLLWLDSFTGSFLYLFLLLNLLWCSCFLLHLFHFILQLQNSFLVLWFWLICFSFSCIDILMSLPQLFFGALWTSWNCHFEFFIRQTRHSCLRGWLLEDYYLLLVSCPAPSLPPPLLEV